MSDNLHPVDSTTVSVYHKTIQTLKNNFLIRKLFIFIFPSWLIYSCIRVHSCIEQFTMIDNKGDNKNLRKSISFSQHEAIARAVRCILVKSDFHVIFTVFFYSLFGSITCHISYMKYSKFFLPEAFYIASILLSAMTYIVHDSALVR